MKKFFIFIILYFCMIPFISAQTNEYMLKGVFIEKFTNFIEWPKTSSVPDTTQSFVIAVLGKNPFGNILNNIYQHQKIYNKTVIIDYSPNLDQLDQYQILFIAGSEKNKLPLILKSVKGKPILTISDTEGFAQTGVMINFYIDGDNVRFEINENELLRSHIKVSHLLFNVAKIVSSGD